MNSSNIDTKNSIYNPDGEKRLVGSKANQRPDGKTSIKVTAGGPH